MPAEGPRGKGPPNVSETRKCEAARQPLEKGFKNWAKPAATPLRPEIASCRRKMNHRIREGYQS